jgi:hypothetical protein
MGDYMKKVFASILFVVLTSISAFAQSFALQNAASYINEAGSSPSVIARGSHTSLYPTVSNFDISGTASSDGNSFSLITSGGDEIRVISTKGTLTYFNTLTYVSASQINIVHVLTCRDSVPTICGFIDSPPFAMHVQKKVGGVWTTIRTLSSYNWVSINPHTFVDYSTGSPLINAALYAFDGTSDYFLLKNVLDGNPNPRTYNGRPTVVSLYLTGAGFAVGCTSTSFCGELRLDGSSAPTIGGFANSPYVGSQQLNFEVPSTMSSTTTIQIGGRASICKVGLGTFCSDGPNILGNIATIPNWN